MAAAKLPAFDLVDAFTLRVPAPDGSEGTTIDRLPFQDLVRAVFEAVLKAGSDARLWLREHGPGPDNGVPFFAAMLGEVAVPGLADVASDCPDGVLPSSVRSRASRGPLPWQLTRDACSYKSWNASWATYGAPSSQFAWWRSATLTRCVLSWRLCVRWIRTVSPRV